MKQEKSFTDLLVVCCLGVLINVLSPVTYSAPGMERHWRMNDVQVALWNECDVNGLSEDERKLHCLTRGRSIELISWLGVTHTTGISDMPVQKLFSTIIVDVCRMLCNYKWQADKNGIYCAPDFTIERLKIQIHAALELVVQRMDLSPATINQLDWDVETWKIPFDDSPSKRILPQVAGLSIRRNSAVIYKRQNQTQLFKMGETGLDWKFAKRLEVKREIIGLSLKIFTVGILPHFCDFRRRCSASGVAMKSTAFAFLIDIGP